LNFFDAATSRPELAKELPRFVAYVRGLFASQEMRTHLARMSASRPSTPPRTTMKKTMCSTMTLS
jgi:hypothetical protein